MKISRAVSELEGKVQIVHLTSPNIERDGDYLVTFDLYDALQVRRLRFDLPFLPYDGLGITWIEGSYYAFDPDESDEFLYKGIYDIQNNT